MKNKKLNVLSLFDGNSGGMQALDRLEILPENYFASEIDKWAMAVSKYNYPDIIQLGDVKNWVNWNLPKIDLLIGGSPCQGFSFAGKQLNFEDPRSKLFFEFVDVLNFYKPRFFMLENVRMKQEYQDIISKQLGVAPIMINSSLVSAQNRVRFYWVGKLGGNGKYTQVEIKQPDDRGLVLKDILIDSNEYNVRGAAKRNQVTKRGVESQLNIRKDFKSNCIVSSWSHKLNGLVEYRPCETRDFKKESLCHHSGTALDIKGNEAIKRIYSDSGKSPTLTTMGGGHREPKVLCNEDKKPVYRKLIPLECERLQTMVDDFTKFGNFDGVVKEISKTQRLKMIGNGWNINTILHLYESFL